MFSRIDPSWGKEVMKAIYGQDIRDPPAPLSSRATFDSSVMNDRLSEVIRNLVSISLRPIGDYTHTR